MPSIGLRIKQARIRRGLSQRALAEQAGVSAMAISKYENQQNTPASDTLIRLADVLDYGLDYFLRPARVHEITPAYRKKSALGKREENRVIEEIRDWLERYIEAEALSPAGDQPRFEYPDGFPRTVRSFDEVEEAAIDLRHAWDVGLDPIEDLTSLLEDAGIKVGVIDASEGFDACAFEATLDGDVPVIVTREGLPGDRQRFNLAHELGHLMLRIEEDPDARFMEERACHRFAGAFIAPRPTILDDLGEQRTHLNGTELHMLKHKYGLSMQALIHRAHDLDVISDHYARTLWKIFRQRGWKQIEPGEPVSPEKPSRFRLLVQQALAEDIISRKRAMELYKGDLETPAEREAFGAGELQQA